VREGLIGPAHEHDGLARFDPIAVVQCQDLEVVPRETLRQTRAEDGDGLVDAAKAADIVERALAQDPPSSTSAISPVQPAPRLTRRHWLIAGGLVGLLSYLFIIASALYYVWKQGETDFSLKKCL
jgi:hypothetical protein